MSDSKTPLSAHTASVKTGAIQGALSVAERELKSMRDYTLTQDEAAHIEWLISQISEVFWAADEIEAMGNPDLDDS